MHEPLKKKKLSLKWKMKMILIRCICPHVNVCHNSHLCALQMMISLMKMKKGIFKKDRSVIKVNIPQFCDCIFKESIPRTFKISQLQRRGP